MLGSALGADTFYNVVHLSGGEAFGQVDVRYQVFVQAVGVLVVSENLPLWGCSIAYHPITYKILFRETNPRRDKNGTEPQENKIKNALLRISASEYLLLRCKGTNLSRQKRIKTHKVHIYSAFFIFLYHGG